MLKRLPKTLAFAVALMLIASMAAACSTAAPANTTANTAATNAASSDVPAYDTITITWYPNESASDYQPVRDEVAKLITQATGKKVDQKLTTDYSIAIEALANGTAQIACAMGAQGYIQAKESNPAVQTLFVNSGASGTLDDAIYYSWMCVNSADAQNYVGSDGKYSIANIQGKRFSFVSNSSTSGFKVPTTNIVAFFGKMDQWKSLTADDLTEGGSGKFFSEVLFGGSHQGSAVNLLSGKADVAAFCDTELATYSALDSGTAETAGAVYKVKDDASAPFDTLVGKTYTIIQSTPVLNGPFAYNSKTLSADDAKKIQDLFTSDTVTGDQLIFLPKDSKNAGLYKQSGKVHFMLVEDKWYDPIRNMGK